MLSTARAPLLELDPELGAQLDPERFAQARALLHAPVVALDGDRLDTAGPGGPGLLIVRGVLARAIVSGGAVAATELLGPATCCGRGPRRTPTCSRSRCAGSRSHACWPRCSTSASRSCWRAGRSVAAVLLDRASERAHRLAVTQAIAQLTGVERRLHALLWHLAARFGRVTPDGVVVPLALSHQRLGELIGARRPTVSTALGVLTREGSLRRREDGGWLLTGEPPQRLAAEALARPA